jgi:hypothetical protein
VKKLFKKINTKVEKIRKTFDDKFRGTMPEAKCDSYGESDWSKSKQIRVSFQ